MALRWTVLLDKRIIRRFTGTKQAAAWRGFWGDLKPNTLVREDSGDGKHGPFLLVSGEAEGFLSCGL